MMRFWSARPIRFVSNPRPSRATCADHDPAFAVEVFADVLFPGIRLVALLLLGLDVLALELPIRPPWLAVPVELDGLGEELVAVAGKLSDIDAPGFHGPEAPAAGFVAQIGVLVRCADENALPRLDRPPCGRSSAGSVRSCG